MTGQDLISKVEQYKTEHSVSASEACEKLKIPVSRYYSAVSYVRAKKKTRVKVQALRKSAPKAATRSFSAFPISFSGRGTSDKAVLIVGDAKTLASIVNQLHG